MEEIKKEDKKIKCFVIAGGSNVISEYVEKCSDDGQDMELYWINPMLADFVKLPTGQIGINMAPLVTFTKDDVVGPVNAFSILCSYDIDQKFINVYENQTLKLRTAKAGLVQAQNMPPNMPKIGDSKFKIVKG